MKNLKAGHLVFLVLALFGGIYVLHMICHHQGQPIVPTKFGSH